MITCPECGHATDAQAKTCANCGHALANGAVPQTAEKPPPPPEVCGLILQEIPSDLVEWARQAFDREEFLEGVREIERTGGVPFEEILHEIEEMVKRRE